MLNAIHSHPPPNTSSVIILVHEDGVCLVEHALLALSCKCICVAQVVSCEKGWVKHVAETPTWALLSLHIPVRCGGFLLSDLDVEAHNHALCSVS